MNSPILHAAAVLAAASPAPGDVVPSSFNGDGFRQGLLWFAVAVFMGLGIFILVKHGRSGNVGQATNSLAVSIIGGILIGAPVLILTIASGAANWLIK
jgi:hypothetical protein